MNIISVISFIVFIIYLFLGTNIYLINYKSRINQLFLFKCLSLSLYTFSFFLIFSGLVKSPYNIIDFTGLHRNNVNIWFDIGYLGVLIFFPLVLHFCITLTNLVRIKHYQLIILYLIPLTFYIINLSGIPVIYKEIRYQDNQWVFILSPNTLLQIIYIAIINLYIILSFIILFIWGRKADNTKQKKQSIVLGFSLLASIVLGMSEEVYLPRLTNYQSHGLTLHFFVIWMIGVWYSIVKYRFLSLTPKMICERIIADIDESIILLDSQFNILFINNKTERLIDENLDNIKGKSLSHIFRNFEKILEEIKKMKNKEFNNFSCRLNYNTINNELLLMDAKFSVVKDKYDDILGILIIGKEVKEMKQLQSIYKISNREAEVIQHIINGDTNTKIAEKLFISERTVKAHNKNIYNKLNVDNRIQLLMLLKEFNLLSEKESEKTLFII